MKYRVLDVDHLGGTTGLVVVIALPEKVKGEQVVWEPIVGTRNHRGWYESELRPWEVEPFVVSGVLTGYRAARRGPLGFFQRKTNHIGDCYVPGSFETAREMAEADADAANITSAPPGTVISGDPEAAMG